jgi:hypothetical protein
MSRFARFGLRSTIAMLAATILVAPMAAADRSEGEHSGDGGQSHASSAAPRGSSPAPSSSSPTSSSASSGNTSGIESGKSEQDRAREAFLQGWAQPLDDVLDHVRIAVPGEVLNVALDQDREGRWTYTIMLISPDGRYREVTVNAKSNRIVRVKVH